MADPAADSPEVALAVEAAAAGNTFYYKNIPAVILGNVFNFLTIRYD